MNFRRSRRKFYLIFSPSYQLPQLWHLGISRAVSAGHEQAVYSQTSVKSQAAAGVNPSQFTTPNSHYPRLHSLHSWANLQHGFHRATAVLSGGVLQPGNTHTHGQSYDGTALYFSGREN